MSPLIEDGGPPEYIVTQGCAFFKRTDDPSNGTILKRKVPTGKRIMSTGCTWTGPSGGVWAELDLARADQVGWVLVKGPGFGLVGPALQDAEILDQLTLVEVVLLSETAGIALEALVAKNVNISDLATMVSARTGLSRDSCIFSKELPANSPNGGRLTADYMMEFKAEESVIINGIGNPVQLFMIYVGDWPENWQPPEPVPIKVPL
eukprot:NODE_19167_length_856_cov_6.115226.p1 GENE.NODE_19167_length_856_cov_6.115226~~NODE_19167_length_856_cov_6.115226.p1  ORF type:complete len:206 (+),score=71.79 NODE_19167_length_856_cov_6.115226:134-751(+)